MYYRFYFLLVLSLVYVVSNHSYVFASDGSQEEGTSRLPSYQNFINRINKNENEIGDDNVLPPLKLPTDLIGQYTLAIKCLKRETREISASQAALIFLRVIKAENIEPQIKHLAAFNLATLKYHNLTTAINDEQAVILFSSCVNNQNLDERARASARLYLAMMRNLCRTNSIGDGEAAQILYSKSILPYKICRQL